MDLVLTIIFGCPTSVQAGTYVRSTFGINWIKDHGAMNK